MKTCKVDGCEQGGKIRLDMCPKHYFRFKRYQSIELPQKPTLKQRFEMGFIRGGTGECWEWQKGKRGRGYGFFSLKGKNMAAHRFCYEINFGKIPPGMFVCHKCDNPPCVNPLHLFLGTPLDNVRDKFNKGRAVIRNRHDPETGRFSKII